MGRNVSLGVGGCTYSTDDSLGIRIEVENTGDAAIDELKIDFEYQYDALQPAGIGHKTGGSFGFSPAAGQPNGRLALGETRTFITMSHFLDQIETLVQSLSSDKYHLSVSMDGEKQVAIPGRDFGQMVEQILGGEAHQE